MISQNHNECVMFKSSVLFARSTGKTTESGLADDLYLSESWETLGWCFVGFWQATYVDLERATVQASVRLTFLSEQL